MTPENAQVEPIQPIELRELLDAKAASAFCVLPHHVAATEETTPASLLLDSFLKMFRCEEARAKSDVVFVWAVDKPYSHGQGNNLTSQLVNIEKTKVTIAERWKPGNLQNLVQDYRDGEVVGDLDSLRPYADVNRNFLFYSRLIHRHGPLRIWWASSEQLNASVESPLGDSRAWEKHMLSRYFARHGCYPLKNRRG